MAKKKEDEEFVVIESVAIIKDAKIKPQCGELNHIGFDFTPSQYAQIARWIKNKETLVVSMRPAQKNLPGME
jgi:hypothetical protein